MWLEVLLGPIAEWMLQDAPRPVRIGCWALLAAAAVGLLTIGLWGRHVL